MICMRCGANIDTTIRGADGSVQCNNCGTVYLPKPANTQPNPYNRMDNNTTSPMVNQQLYAEQTQRRRRANYSEAPLSNTAHREKSPSLLKNKFLSLPIWTWLCAILIIGGGATAWAATRDSGTDYHQNVGNNSTVSSSVLAEFIAFL